MHEYVKSTFECKVIWMTEHKQPTRTLEKTIAEGEKVNYAMLGEKIPFIIAEKIYTYRTIQKTVNNWIPHDKKMSTTL